MLMSALAEKDCETASAVPKAYCTANCSSYSYIKHTSSSSHLFTYS